MRGYQPPLTDESFTILNALRDGDTLLWDKKRGCWLLLDAGELDSDHVAPLQSRDLIERVSDGLGASEFVITDKGYWKLDWYITRTTGKKPTVRIEGR